MSIFYRVVILPLYCITLVLLATSSQATVPILSEKESTQITARSSHWLFEFGPRYWLSTGQFKLNLLSPQGGLASRLTYDKWVGNTAEGFWQLRHENGLFLKGYFGGGSKDGGQFIDEDFPPVKIPYSRTYSVQKNGSINYLSMDLGYYLPSNENWQIGGFIGYQYWSEHYNAFGAKQLASNSLFGNIPPEFGPAPTTINLHNEFVALNSLRLGISGAIELSNALKLMTDIAYIHSNLSAKDSHNFRPEIDGLFEDGTGNGVQIDAILDWKLTHQLSIGAGGRWWYLRTNGLIHSEQTYSSVLPHAIETTQDSFGLLLQGNYKFEDGSKLANALFKDAETSSIFSWSGLFIGANLGYGTNPSDVYIYPTSTSTQLSQFLYNTPPSALYVQDAGFLAGGEIGYNWQVKQVIFGVEGDLDYAGIGGANATTSSAIAILTSVDKNISWMGTVRGRFGKLISDNMLVYLTGGPAFGKVSMIFDQRMPGTNCPYNLICLSSTKSQTKSGWVAGGGLEYAVNKRTTFKAEYLYIALGQLGLNAIGSSILGPASIHANSNFDNNIVRLGVNYKI